MKKEITCFEAPKIMEKALDVGEAMLCTGAEISRVEDTILRICHTYGGGVIDVFTILSLMIRISPRRDESIPIPQTWVNWKS